MQGLNYQYRYKDSTGDDEGSHSGSPSPVTQKPDIEPHLKSFTCFGWQIANGMVRAGSALELLDLYALSIDS